MTFNSSYKSEGEPVCHIQARSLRVNMHAAHGGPLHGGPSLVPFVPSSTGRVWWLSKELNGTPYG